MLGKQAHFDQSQSLLFHLMKKDLNKIENSEAQIQSSCDIVTLGGSRFVSPPAVSKKMKQRSSKSGLEEDKRGRFS